VHAAFQSLLAGASPSLPAWLHETQRGSVGTGGRPYTLSPLLLGGEWPGRNFTASSGEVYALRITCLLDALTEVVLEAVRPGCLVRIGRQAFRVQGVLTEPRLTDGWARSASYEELLDTADRHTDIALAFLTPAAIRQGDVDRLFPLPGSVFLSYARRWAMFGGPPLADALGEVVNHRFGEVGHAMHVATFSYDPKSPIGGFVGWCTYRVQGRADPWAIRSLNALADYALFAGTGRKVTHGMGQTRRIQPMPADDAT
jgi:CRISPR-associated endoribonuclease Cas6